MYEYGYGIETTTFKIKVFDVGNFKILPNSLKIVLGD